MKKTVISIMTAMLLSVASSAFAIGGDVILPTPQKQGGPSVLEAISNRRSSKTFARRDVELKELSTILWAATGKTGADRGWAVPMAMGADPYVSVYVLNKDGCYLYSWEKHVLSFVSDKKMLTKAGTQAYVGTAPIILVFATKGAGPRIENWAEIAVGAMSQNVYLSAEALGMKTRFVASYNKMMLIDALNIGPLSRIIAIMPLGY